MKFNKYQLYTLASAAVFSAAMPVLAAVIRTKRHTNLEDLSNMSNVVLALLAMFAAATYYYQKNKDQTEAIITLLDFARDNLIDIKDEIAHEICKRLSIQQSDILTTRIEQLDIEYLKKHFPNVVRQQTEFFYLLEGDIRSKMTAHINLLEEFAQRTLHQNARDEALVPVIPLFVQSVEEYIVYILIESTVPGNGSFPGIRKLYLKWRDHPAVNRGIKSLSKRNSVVSKILTDLASPLFEDYKKGNRK